jgi:apolipoprotein N-acyltransferase
MAGSPGLPRPLLYGGSLLCGALPVLAFPAPSLALVAWVGLVPGLLLIRCAASPGRAALAGWWFGAGYLLAALYWLIPNLGPGLLLVVAVLGALWAGAGAACQVLLRAPVRAGRAAAALLVIPSCWVTSEWLRSWPGFGGPWAVFGGSQWQHPAVLGLAAVGGVWLVSFALVAANTGVLIAVAARAMTVRLIGVAGCGLAVAAGPAAFALTTAPAPARQLPVALVQPGLTASARLRAAASQRLSAGLRRDHPGLIVWGESSIAYDLAQDTALRTQLQRLAAADGAQLLVSQDTISPAGAKSKTAVLIGPAGIAGTYTKSRLVPFGEYIPFRQQLGWLTSISRAAPQNMIPGTGARVLTASVPGGPLRIGVLICFESAFPDLARADTQQGAQVIVYQTSDSTFQASWELAQHASLAAVRAAETGRPTVQAALTGVSAAFDARGRQLAWVPGGHRGVPVVRLVLPPAAYRTLFDRRGPWLPWTAVTITAAAAIAAAAWGRPRPVRPDRPPRILWNRNLRAGPGVSVGQRFPGAAPGHEEAEQCGSAASHPGGAAGQAARWWAACWPCCWRPARAGPARVLARATGPPAASRAAARPHPPRPAPR